MVNNAGITRDGTLAKMSFDDWNEVMRVNLGGCFNMAKACFPGMREAKWGRIVNIGGMTARITAPLRVTNGIVNAGVAGTAKGDQITASVEPGNLLVAANPQLAIGTNSVLEKAEGNEGEGAETGDTITYKYTVENVGNVSVADVAVTVDLAGKTLQSQGTPDLGVDPFEVTVSANDPLGLNEDDPETAGVYDMLGPGGAVEFTHAHVVTQEEFEAQ
mgnify:CR=1 FL=1